MACASCGQKYVAKTPVAARAPAPQAQVGPRTSQAGNNIVGPPGGYQITRKKPAIQVTTGNDLQGE